MQLISASVNTLKQKKGEHAMHLSPLTNLSKIKLLAHGWRQLLCSPLTVR